MKVEWAPEDIRAGRIVGKADRKERWMIGYLVHEASEHRWAMVAMSDGMIQPFQSAKLMAMFLTAEGEMPAELLPPR